MKKIIITSVIVGLVLCLGIATLILGLVPVGMNDKVNVPDEVYIYCSQVYNTPSKRREYRHRDGQEDISKINKINNYRFKNKRTNTATYNNIKHFFQPHILYLFLLFVLFPSEIIVYLTLLQKH